jgi:opacity protein-like surface antigen
MRRSELLPLLALLLALLVATPAAAQEGVGDALAGSSRISVQGGWRMAQNDTFYNAFYSRPENAGLERASPTRGGPLAVATFAYSFADTMEMGIDLFATTQKMALTGQPPLKTASYGALLGLRYQTVLDIGPYGTVPFVGLLTGPFVAAAAFEGQKARETLLQAWAAAAGASMSLTPRWGLCLEYRFVLARGGVGAPEQRLGSFNAGGSWLTLGLTYTFAKQPTSPLSHPF